MGRAELLYSGISVRTIPLTQGKVAFVDDSDYAALSQKKWRASLCDGIFYARTTSGYMHSLLIPGVPRVDHRNGDGLDNQRHNLRPATQQQNSCNARKWKTPTSSRYKGVYLRKIKNRHGEITYRCWGAHIRVMGKRIVLGNFKTESAAAGAYDVAAKRYFGEFARCNFI